MKTESGGVPADVKILFATAVWLYPRRLFLSGKSRRKV